MEINNSNTVNIVSFIYQQKKYVIAWLITFILSSNIACGFNLPTASITIRVVDENGMPINGAKAGVGFESVYRFKGGINDVGITGLTDRDGIFTASHDTSGYIGYGAEIDGYYISRSEYRFTKHESGKWQPWNPEIKVVMRKIEKPVPMYARDLKNSFPNVEIPVIGKEVGFDLMEYDWVAPYGHGKQVDFIFKLERSSKNENNFDATLTIAFANKFDGIQVIRDDRKGGSVFKLPRYAPEEGYQNKLTRFIRGKGIGSIEDDTQKDNNYSGSS